MVLKHWHLELWMLLHASFMTERQVSTWVAVWLVTGSSMVVVFLCNEADCLDDTTRFWMGQGFGRKNWRNNNLQSYPMEQFQQWRNDNSWLLEPYHWCVGRWKTERNKISETGYFGVAFSMLRRFHTIRNEQNCDIHSGHYPTRWTQITPLCWGPKSAIILLEKQLIKT